MSPDLHSRIASELSRRLEVAKAADFGPWEVGPTFGALDNRVYVRREGDHIDSIGTCVIAGQVSNMPRFRENAAHIALHDPADADRRYEAALRLLEHHRPVVLRGGPGGKYYETTTVCATCSPPQFAEFAWPCTTLLYLAASLGLDTEGSTTDG